MAKPDSQEMGNPQGATKTAERTSSGQSLVATVSLWCLAWLIGAALVLPQSACISYLTPIFAGYPFRDAGSMGLALPHPGARSLEIGAGHC